MPKLSSAETPPEKSSDCLPVSTIAESGVITRMPLVCMSIVASAFQYGWAPTLIPATTMLISPPAWVKSTMRFSAAATQSMFSVPDSIEMRAPADSANHSTGMRSPLGEVEGGDHPRALRLGQRAERLRRVAEQHDARHPLRVPPGRRADHARDQGGGVLATRPVDWHQVAVAVQVVLGEAAAGPGEHAGQLVRVDGAAPARPQHLLPVVVQRLDQAGRRARRPPAGSRNRPRSRCAPRCRSARRSRGPAGGRGTRHPPARRPPWWAGCAGRQCSAPRRSARSAARRR